MQKFSYTTRIGERDIVIETGTLAKLAGGAVTLYEVKGGKWAALETVHSGAQ
mgnify:CR=1 FL=1